MKKLCRCVLIRYDLDHCRARVAQGPNIAWTLNIIPILFGLYLWNIFHLAQTMYGGVAENRSSAVWVELTNQVPLCVLFYWYQSVIITDLAMVLKHVFYGDTQLVATHIFPLWVIFSFLCVRKKILSCRFLSSS